MHWNITYQIHRSFCFILFLYLTSCPLCWIAAIASSEKRSLCVSAAEVSISQQLWQSRHRVQLQPAESHLLTRTETNQLHRRSEVEMHCTRIWWNLIYPHAEAGSVSLFSARLLLLLLFWRNHPIIQNCQNLINCRAKPSWSSWPFKKTDMLCLTNLWDQLSRKNDKT